MSALTDYAHVYLSAGLHIIALSGKRPNGEFHAEWTYENSIHGIPESDEDNATIDAVFTHPTTTGIAILIPPHMLVADVDTEDAAALFMSLVDEMPETPAAKTASGLHIWFAHPPAEKSVWLGGRSLLFKGLNGYVVAPPSWHPGDKEKGVEPGHHYEWLVPLVDETSGRVAGIEFLPPRMAEALRVLASVEKRSDVPYSPPFIPKLVITDGVWRSETIQMDTIDGLCSAIIEAADGNQNNVIAWAAMTAQEEGVPLETAMDRLLAASIEGGHPAARAKQTIKGVYQRRKVR